MKSFKAFRIFILLLVLASVVTTRNLQRDVSRDWQGVVEINIVPVIADQNPATRDFVYGLKERDFSEVSKYLIAQGKRHDRSLEASLKIRLVAPITDVPPLPPAASEGVLDVMLWSLKLRWWAWRNEASDHDSLQVRLYILYQTPEKNERLAHSTGLQNGLIGLIHARAQKQRGRHNNVVLVHELLHILGASDKYDLASGKPVYPGGYAEPDRRPTHPQRRAEIMAGVIPISANEFNAAVRLGQTIIGDITAFEIGWSESL